MGLETRTLSPGVANKVCPGILFPGMFIAGGAVVQVVGNGPSFLGIRWGISDEALILPMGDSKTWLRTIQNQAGWHKHGHEKAGQAGGPSREPVTESRTVAGRMKG